ncbi:MAG: polysaccharide pyruvyl transferase family protein [Candidatus Odinarchaeia archaeon]
MTYILLTRALKNVGDFLIFDRAKKLIKKYKKNYFIELPSWKPLDNYLKIINESDALIICGGPGIQPNFYPSIYPLIKNLEDISVPIILFGIGWYGFPGDDTDLHSFNFTPASLKALRKIHECAPFISCRDHLTEEILLRNGFTKVIMTGCPSWYDLKHLHKPFISHKKIKKVVFTVPQREIYYSQALKVMKILKEIFSNATLYCSFHSGRERDIFTSYEESRELTKLKNEAIKLGYEVKNVAYDLSKIKFYDNCDLHIGYRLHAHIYFLSQRKPSFLLSEDSRGRGFSEAIKLASVRAWEIGEIGKLCNWILENVKSPKELLSAVSIFKKFLVKPSKMAVDYLKKSIQKEIECGFMQFRGLENAFMKYFKKMEKFLISLP